MFDKILQTAYESGAEVLVQIKECCCDQYKGRVLELDSDYFALFHTGAGGGVRWAFRRADIAFVGLVVGLPDPHNSQAQLMDVSIEPQYERLEGE